MAIMDRDNRHSINGVVIPIDLSYRNIDHAHIAELAGLAH